MFNKAINLYINKVYNVYDINQLTTDDLRVLKATAYLIPEKINPNNSATTVGTRSFAKKGNTYYYNGDTEPNSAGINAVPISDYTLIQEIKDGTSTVKYVVLKTDAINNASSYLSKRHSSILSLRSANYEVHMPIDYLHMLNCVCIYYVTKQKDCWDAGSYIEVPATRLTADSWSQIVTDIYNRPSPMKPYYYIHNDSTDDMNDFYRVTDMAAGNTLDAIYGNTDAPEDAETLISNFDRTFKLGTKDASLIEKPIATRFGNNSTVRCEIRYGKRVSTQDLNIIIQFS